MSKSFPYQELDIGGLEWPRRDDGTQLIPRFLAYEYPSNHAARLAWEKVDRKAKEVSCSRMSGRGSPPTPPFIVVCVGEDMERLKQVNRLLTSVHGARFFVLDAEMAKALAVRRYSLAAEAGRRGEPMRHVHRYGQEGRPMRLTEEGEMIPDERKGL